MSDFVPMDNDDDDEMEVITLDAMVVEKPTSRPSVKTTSGLTATIYLGVCLMCNGMAFMALLPVISSLYNDVGAFAVSFTNLVFALASCFVAPVMVQRLGCKRALIVSSSGYTVWAAAALYPTMLCMGTAAAFTGAISACLWSAQASYVAFVSTPDTIGKHTGVFWTLYLLAIPIGNFLSTTLLTYANVTVFILTLVGISMLSTVLLVFLPPVDDSSLQLVEYNMNPVATFRQIIALLRRSPRLRWATPAFLYFGMSVPLTQSWFPTAVLAPRYGVDHVGASMIFFGLADVASCVLVGRLADSFGRPLVFACGIGCTFVGLLVVVSGVDYPAPAVAVLFGIADATMNVVSNSFIGSKMKDDIAATVAFFRLTSGVMAFVCFQTFYVFPELLVAAIGMVSVALAIGAYFVAERVT